LISHKKEWPRLLVSTDPNPDLALHRNPSLTVSPTWRLFNCFTRDILQTYATSDAGKISSSSFSLPGSLQSTCHDANTIIALARQRLPFVGLDLDPLLRISLPGPRLAECFMFHRPASAEAGKFLQFNPVLLI
jgi:hypothetical protein